MAIVDMKRVELLALEKDKPRITRALQKLQCFQPTPAEEKDARAPSDGEALSHLDEQITRVTWAIGKLNRYDKTKKPFLGDKPALTEEDARKVTDDGARLMETVDALEALEREAGELRGQTARIQAAREQLTPWRGLSLPIEDVAATRNTVSLLGMAPKTALETLLQSGALSPLCVVETVGAQRDQACVYVVAHASCAEEAMRLLKEAGFAQTSLPLSQGTVEKRLTQMEAEDQAIDARQAEILTLVEARATELNELKVYSDCLQSERERLLAAQSFAASERTFYVRGWTPKPMAEALEAKVKKVSPSACLSFSDPQPDDDPPVLLHNSAVVSPFETIVSGFSLPLYGGFDPTAVMMPFFVNFMGMMISDAGYGVLMALVLPILIKYLKPAPGTKRLMKILTWGAIATVVWGALYNTWFGFAPLPSVFDPVNNALPVMLMCVALGAIHLFAGLGCAAYVNIRNGKPLAAVADQLSWFLIVVGLGLMLVAPQIGKWVAITGAAIILVTSGREKSKNPFKRLLSGLGALYGVTSWVSDLLSYMRLFGMGLATGVIGMVINQLIAMIFSAGPIGWVLGSIIFVGGHMFNLGINVLGAYVHSCRLQYIEFFGKFYEDGGKPFKPLSDVQKYVYVREADQRA